LDSNGIGDEGGFAIGKALEINSTLKELKYGPSNPLLPQSEFYRWSAKNY
jgi:hypothetical protein